MSFDLAPTRYNFGLREAGRRFELRLSREIFSEIVNPNDRIFDVVLCITGISQGAGSFSFSVALQDFTALRRPSAPSAQAKTPALLPGFCIP
jgi:hypothetical protein